MVKFFTRRRAFAIVLFASLYGASRLYSNQVNEWKRKNKYSIGRQILSYFVLAFFIAWFVLIIRLAFFTGESESIYMAPIYSPVTVTPPSSYEQPAQAGGLTKE